MIFSHCREGVAFDLSLEGVPFHFFAFDLSSLYGRCGI